MASEPFADACRRKDFEEMERILRDDEGEVEVDDYRDRKTGATALILAATWGKLDLVKLLLNKGADVNAENDEMNTPLDVAVEHKRAAVVEILLKRKDINICACDNKNKPPPVLRAVWNDDEEILGLLFRSSKTCIKYADKRGWTLLHHAVAKRFASLTGFLLLRGADPNLPDEDGYTPLHRAVKLEWTYNGYADRENWVYPPSIETVEALLHCPEINVNAQTKEKRTALHFAAESHWYLGIKLLLGVKRADVNIQDSEMKTPLFLAFHPPAIKYLRLDLFGGELPDAVWDDLEGVATGTAGCVSLLTQSGAKTNILAKDDETVLHVATRWEVIPHPKWDMCTWMSKLVNCSNKENETPLSIAIEHWHEEGVKRLLELGANVDLLREDFVKRWQESWQKSGDSFRPLDGPLPASIRLWANFPNVTRISKQLCKNGARWDEFCDEAFDDIMAISVKAGCYAEPADLKRYREEVEDCYTEYEKMKKTPSVVSKRFKVCVVGPTECGKTTLVKALTGRGASGEDGRTLGIDRTVLPFGESDIPLEVTLWDFVGQEVYQTAHSLFFTETSLYLLCVNLEKYNEILKTRDEERVEAFVEDNIFSWVNAVSQNERNPEIVVVGTKRDRIEEEEAIKNDLECRWKKKKYRFDPKEWIHVSSIDDDSVSKALEVIRPIITKSGAAFNDDHMFVLKWIHKERGTVKGANIADRLVRMIQPQKELRKQLQTETKVPETEDILKLFHDLGEVHLLHSKTGDPMHAFAVLDPSLLFELMNEIITPKSDEDEDEDVKLGIVRHDSLSKFQHWNCLRANYGLIYRLKCLLEQLELAYPLGPDEMDWDSDLSVPSHWERNTQPSTGSLGEDAAVSYHFVYKLPPAHSRNVFRRFAAGQCTDNQWRIFKDKIIHTDSDCETTIDLDATTRHEGDRKVHTINLRVAGSKKETVLRLLLGITSTMELALKHSEGVVKYVKDDTGKDRSWKSIAQNLNGPAGTDYFSSNEWLPSNFEAIQCNAPFPKAFAKLEKDIEEGVGTIITTVTAPKWKTHYPQQWKLMYHREVGQVQLHMLCDMGMRCKYGPKVIPIKYTERHAKYDKPLKAGLFVLEGVFEMVGMKPIFEKILPDMKKKIDNDVKTHELVSLLDLSDSEARVAGEKLSGEKAADLLRELLRKYKEESNEDFNEDYDVTLLSDLTRQTHKGNYIWVHRECYSSKVRDQQPEKENDPSSATENKEALDVKLSILDIDDITLRRRLFNYKFFVSWELKSDQNIICKGEDLTVKKDTTFRVASREQLAKCTFSVDVKRETLSSTTVRKSVGKGSEEIPFGNLQDGASTVSFDVKVHGEDEKCSVKVRLEVVH